MSTHTETQEKIIAITGAKKYICGTILGSLPKNR